MGNSKKTADASRSLTHGCAAVHIGILRRVVVINDKSGVIELVNPIITKQSTETAQVLEGSIAPGAPWGIVERPIKVTVTAKNRNGEHITMTVEGFLAATLCHETDHLDGILFTQKATRIITDPEELKRIQKNGV